MFPSQTQRVLMLAGVVVSTPSLSWAVGRLCAADGMAGWTLLDAPQGVVLGVGLLVLAALPCVVAAVFLSATGNPLSALTTAGLSAVLALGFGTRRTDGLPFDSALRRALGDPLGSGGGEAFFGRLSVELIVWAALLVAGLGVLEALHRAVRPGLPRRLRSEHLGEKTRLLAVDGPALLAGLVSAAVAGVMMMILVRSAAAGQVFGGVAASFLIGGVMGQLVVPQDKPLATLLSPTLVGLGGYGYGWWRVGGGEALLSASYRGELPGVCAGLPAYVAAAGLLGGTIGIGIGQVLERARVRAMVPG